MEDFLIKEEQFSGDELFSDGPTMELFSNESLGSGHEFLQEDFQFLSWADDKDVLQNSCNDDFDLKFEIKPEGFESPILTNALTSVPYKAEPVKNVRQVHEKIVFPGDVEPLQISGNKQADNLLKRITQARSVMINGEREIIGKNIIGLHCLNEIKTSPDQKSQTTSTVINGKKINIIIKPKSSRTLDRVVLPPDDTIIKVEPVDEMITELKNGDYDLVNNEELDSWMLSMPYDVEEVELPTRVPSPPPEPPRVPPLRIKIPKPKITKKHKKKATTKKNTKTAKKPTMRTQTKAETVSPYQLFDDDDVSSPQLSDDSIPVDHSYCFSRRCDSKKDNSLAEKSPRKDSGLESGGMSDASEGCSSSNPNSPVSVTPSSAPFLAKELTSKLLEERCRPHNHSSVTKLAVALYRASNAVTSGSTSTQSVNSTLATPAEPNCDSPVEGTPEVTEVPPAQAVVERPRRKLKLEEYLNRRNDNPECVATRAIEHINPVAAETDPSDQLEEGEVPSDQVSADDDVPALMITISENDTSLHCNAESNGNSKSSDSADTLKESHPQTENSRKLLDGDEHRSRKHATRNDWEDNSRSERSDLPRGQGERLTRDYQEKRRRSSCEVLSKREKEMRLSPRTRRPSLRQSRLSSTSSMEERRYRRNSARSLSRERARRRERSSSSSSNSSEDTWSMSSRRRRSLNSPSRYRRRTRSRSPTRGVSKSRYRTSRKRNKTGHGLPSRSRSPIYSHREKQRQIEERRVVYVGRIAEGTSSQQLRQRFSKFGPIDDISLHFREHGDNYGFVTYRYKEDAYKAVEHGNDDRTLPRYDVFFGGRRSFCKQRYADLGNLGHPLPNYFCRAPIPFPIHMNDEMPTSFSAFDDPPILRRDNSFDLLLEQAKAKLNHRKEAT